MTQLKFKMEITVVATTKPTVRGYTGVTFEQAYEADISDEAVSRMIEAL